MQIGIISMQNLYSAGLGVHPNHSNFPFDVISKVCHRWSLFAWIWYNPCCANYHAPGDINQTEEKLSSNSEDKIFQGPRKRKWYGVNAESGDSVCCWLGLNLVSHREAWPPIQLHGAYYRKEIRTIELKVLPLVRQIFVEGKIFVSMSNERIPVFSLP